MYNVVTIYPDGRPPEVKQQPKAPDLRQLQGIVGGSIETVPHFTKLDLNGREYRRGVAYCNENGQLLRLPHNETATSAWLAVLGKGPFRYEPRLVGTVVFYAREPKTK